MKPLRICHICGESRPAAKKTNEEFLCYSCYRKVIYEKSKNICIECNEIRPIYKNNICVKCFKYKKQECKKCGELKIIHGHGLCSKCYKSPNSFCSKCLEKKIIHSEGLCECCYRKKRRNENINIKIISRLRARLNKCFKKYSISGKIMVSKKYGIDYTAIIEHLGPCPGEDYQIDHILPLSAFDFDDPNQIKKAFSPENHQWLKTDENLKKHNHFLEQDLIDFLRK